MRRGGDAGRSSAAIRARGAECGRGGAARGRDREKVHRAIDTLAVEIFVRGTRDGAALIIL
jgi:hypothetical protein